MNLNITDIDLSSRKLTIRSAKGNKDRTVFIAIKALPVILKWLDLRGIETEQTPALFLPVRKGGTIIYERDSIPARLSSQAVYNMLKKRTKEADIASASPHDFRRTLIGDLLDNSVDIVTVSKVVGHASPAVTSKHDRRPERTKRDALDTLDVPQLWFDV